MRRFAGRNKSPEEPPHKAIMPRQTQKPPAALPHDRGRPDRLEGARAHDMIFKPHPFTITRLAREACPSGVVAGRFLELSIVAPELRAPELRSWMSSSRPT